jgi:hypothetical protein
VIGVEFVEELHTAAMRNIARFPHRRMRCGEITPVHEDAARFGFPEAPLVVYFNNPFSERIMAAVLANLRSSYRRQPRPMIVVYQQLTAEEERHSTENLRLLDDQDFLSPRRPRFSLLDRLRLSQYTIELHETPEAAALTRTNTRPASRRTG